MFRFLTKLRLQNYQAEKFLESESVWRRVYPCIVLTLLRSSEKRCRRSGCGFCGADIAAPPWSPSEFPPSPLNAVHILPPRFVAPAPHYTCARHFLKVRIKNSFFSFNFWHSRQATQLCWWFCATGCLVCLSVALLSSCCFFTFSAERRMHVSWRKTTGSPGLT